MPLTVLIAAEAACLPPAQNDRPPLERLANSGRVLRPGFTAHVGDRAYPVIAVLTRTLVIETDDGRELVPVAVVLVDADYLVWEAVALSQNHRAGVRGRRAASLSRRRRRLSEAGFDEAV